MIELAIVAFAFALWPAALYVRNARLFREPPESPFSRDAEALRSGARESPPALRSEDSASRLNGLSISVLIPARNEEAGIADAVESVLASRGVELECVVLDDHSDDRTAAVVQEMARKDARLRLESAPPLPPGWSGKQHACFCLAGLAKYPLLSFLDADVRLAPDALARMAAFQQASHAALVSGFPRQETGTFLEKLLIPLIHFLLLGYLPFKWMRKSVRPGFGAGCGQWFLTTRNAYNRVGGHSHLSVRNSFHDGVRLPRAYRAAGLMTDLCDVTNLATCRMYRTAGQVWNGLAKNAREGLAAPRLILFSTLMLFCGQVLPFALLPVADGWPLVLALAACVLALLPRVHGTVRFRQSWLGALLHPFGVLTLLAVQWYATVRAMMGKPVGWKGRTKPESSSGSRTIP